MTKVQADDLSFLRTVRALFAQNLFECLPLDEFHPETNSALEIVRPENGDYIAVPDLGEKTSFVDHGGGGGLVNRLEMKKLERNFAVQTRVPRPEHRPEGTASYLGANTQRAPRLQRRNL